jgi:hypothetical protein
MPGRLASHRFRRRLIWSSAGIAALAAIVGGSILIGNTGRSVDTARSAEPAWVYEEPAAHRLTKEERVELLARSSHFVQTAVARRNLDEAWELLGPEMRAGQTRASWKSGDNNVVPFPAAGISAWSVLYSYDGDVAFDLALVARPGGDIVGKTFTIELKRYPERGGRWLVAAWVPKGLTGVGQSKSAAAQPPPPPPRAPLSAAWMFVPLSVLGLIVVIPLAIGLHSWLRHRRAAKRYALELSRYRSSSNPS